MKNKYIKWLWYSLIIQLIYITTSFVLQEYVNENFKWMLIIIVPGILFNTWLDRKADKVDELIKKGGVKDNPPFTHEKPENEKS